MGLLDGKRITTVLPVKSFGVGTCPDCAMPNAALIIVAMRVSSEPFSCCVCRSVVVAVLLACSFAVTATTRAVRAEKNSQNWGLDRS